MRTEKEVGELVREFESCSLALDSFTHGAHLTVALFYLTRMPVTDAAERFRRRIKAFIKHYEKTGYNETITMFWLDRIVRFLMKGEAERSFTDRLDGLLESHGDSRSIYDYYSRERLRSDEAKTVWLAPDLKALDF